MIADILLHNPSVQDVARPNVGMNKKNGRIEAGRTTISNTRLDSKSVHVPLISCLLFTSPQNIVFEATN